MGRNAEYLSVHSTRLHVYKLDYKINFFVSFAGSKIRKKEKGTKTKTGVSDSSEFSCYSEILSTEKRTTR